MRTAPSSASTATAASSAASRSACWSACPAMVSRDPPAGLGHPLGWSPPCLGARSELGAPWSRAPLPPSIGLGFPTEMGPPLGRDPPGIRPPPPPQSWNTPTGSVPLPRARIPTLTVPPHPPQVALGHSYKAGTPPGLGNPIGLGPPQGCALLWERRTGCCTHPILCPLPARCPRGAGGGVMAVTPAVPVVLGGVSPRPLTLLSPQPCASGASPSGRSSGCWRRCRAP